MIPRFKDYGKWWRFFTYAPGKWDGPRLMLSGDEYGWRTLAMNLPYFGTLVFRYYWDEKAADDIWYGPEGWHPHTEYKRDEDGCCEDDEWGYDDQGNIVDLR